MSVNISSECRRFQFRLSLIERLAPGGCGVYAFWYRDRCIYVGMAQKQSVQKRLLDHWSGTHNAELKLWIEAKRDSISVCCKLMQDESQVAAEERRQISRLQPLANKIRYAREGYPSEEE